MLSELIILCHRSGGKQLLEHLQVHLVFEMVDVLLTDVLGVLKFLKHILENRIMFQPMVRHYSYCHCS